MTDFTYDGKDLEIMGAAKNYNNWILSIFRPFLGKNLAEVGAGTGNFSEVLLKEPIDELVAVEPCTLVHAVLQNRLASDKRASTRNDIFSKVSVDYGEHFDSILYINVLEHVEDDLVELETVYRALRPGGHACIFVPALPWLYSSHDAHIGHYRRYTKRELENRVRAAGFEIVRTRYFDSPGILPWLVYVKWMGKTPGAGDISLYDSFVVPIARAIESFITPPIGKNLVLVARKGKI